MPDYFSVKAINNTALGYINLKKGGSLQKFKQFMDGTLEDDEKKYQRIGSLVHLHNLEPEKFKVADVERPSDAVVSIMDSVFAVARMECEDNYYPEVGKLEDWEGNILIAANEYGYQTNWKDETRVKKIIEAGSAYFDYLVERETTDQIVLTSKEFATVAACSASLKLDPHISKIMFPGNLPEGVEVLREHEIYFEYRGFKCKAKLDMLIINHRKKLYQIVDLKTTSKSVINFNESFNDYDYYRQFAFYDIAVRSEFPDYRMVGDPLCVAVETTNFNRARLFVVSSRAIEYGLSEVDRLLDLIDECQKTGNWEYEPEYIENPYELTLEL